MSRVVKNDRDEEYEVDENNYLIDGVLIKVHLNEVVRCDYEQFLDMIAEDAGFPLLEEASCEIDGHEDDTLLLRVRGNVGTHLESSLSEE